MKVPDLEAEIEEASRMLHFTCKNCGCTWSKHKIKRWTCSLACPTLPGARKTYYVGIMDKR